MDPQAMQRVTQGSTCIEILAAMFREYAQRVAFGYCPPGENKFVTLTYGQTWERVQVSKRCMTRGLGHEKFWVCIWLCACGSIWV